jgi:hypothetical protein
MSASPRTATLTSANSKAVVGALGTLAVALLTIVTVFKAVHWSAAQTALVTAEAAAVTGFVTALVAHRMRGTKQEPVAVAATFTATVSATLALGSGFGWWSLNEQKTSALVGVVTAVLAVGGAMFARDRVRAHVSSSTK